MSEHEKSVIELAENDIKDLDKMSSILRDFVWKKEACGKSGSSELLEAQKQVRHVIKAMANYI